MADRFYHPGPLITGLVSLEADEAHHIAHVLRRQAGDEVVLFNGDGAEYVGRLETVGKGRVEVNVLERRPADREAGRQMTIACPLPKGDRGQFLIEKLAELGVARYVPLRTRRSVVHAGEGKADKLRRYVIEASKQCGRNVLMQLDATTSWADLAQRPDLPPARWLAHPTGEATAALATSDGTCLVAIGPEGGWTDDEVSLGVHHEWRVVSLGKSILRVETAAVAAASVCLHSHP